MKKIYLYMAFMLCSTGVYAQPNLVAHWDFNGANVNLPTTVYEVLHGWPCNVVGTLFQTSGLSGAPNTALVFGSETNPLYPNGIGPSFITMPHHPELDLQSWTIFVFAKITDCNTNFQACQVGAMVWKGHEHDGGAYSLVYTDDPWDNDCNKTSAWYGVTVANPPDGILPYITGAPMNPDWMGTPPYPNQPLLTGSSNLGTYRCIVGAYDAVNGVVSVYIDGVKRVSKPWIDNGAPPPTPQEFFIGNSDYALAGPGSEYNQFWGAIDDIKIYDGVFPDDDIYIACEQGVHKGTSVNEIHKDNLQITPNPAHESLSIKLPADWKNNKYTMKNIVGSIISTGVINSTVTIDTENIPEGMYMITIDNNGVATERKVMIIH